MGVDRIVSISITRREGVRGLTSQDNLVLLSHDTPNASFGSDMVKRYSINSLTSVATDWGTGSTVYKAFQKAAGMKPVIPYIYVAKRGTPVAVEGTIVFSGDVLTGQTITGSVNGTAISVPFDTDMAGTMADLDTAVSAVQGVAGAVVASRTLTITASSEYPLDIGDFTVTGAGTLPTAVSTITVAGHTAADDIADMFAENKTPYLIYLTSTNEGAILAAAEYVQTLKKTLFVQSIDTNIVTSATDDLASQLQDAGYTNTAIFYTTDSTQHYPAALAAHCLAYAPGKVAFHNKTLPGITADDLDDNEIGYAETKYCNTYVVTLGDDGLVLQGVMVDGNQIHATRSEHYFQSQLEAEMGAFLKNNPIITFNARGLKRAEDVGQGTYNRMARELVFDPEQPYEFKAPDLADIPSGDKTAHLASGFTGRSSILGAVVKISANLDLQL